LYKITIEQDGEVRKVIEAMKYCVFAEEERGYKMEAACDSVFLAFVAKEADLNFTVVRMRAIEEQLKK
jgi:hypothetical protein